MCVMQNLQLRLLNAAAVKRSLTAGCEVGLDWSLPRLQLSTDFCTGNWETEISPLDQKPSNKTSSAKKREKFLMIAISALLTEKYDCTCRSAGKLFSSA